MGSDGDIRDFHGGREIISGGGEEMFTDGDMGMGRYLVMGRRVSPWMGSPHRWGFHGDSWGDGEG
jgi:hypothetical protein